MVTATGETDLPKAQIRSHSMYDVPVLTKFELSGTKNDVERFVQGVHAIAAH